MELTTSTKVHPQDDIWHDIKVNPNDTSCCWRVEENLLDILQSSEFDDSIGDPLSDSLLVDSVSRLCHSSVVEKETLQYHSNETSRTGLSEI